MQPVSPCLLVLGLMVVGWHAGSSDAVVTIPGNHTESTRPEPTLEPFLDSNDWESAPDSSTCMAAWLMGTFTESELGASYSQTQTALAQASPAVDELTLPHTSPFALALILGSYENADKLKGQCSLHHESCRRPTSCLNRGLCVHTFSLGYRCLCPKGYSGDKCQTAPAPSCTLTNPCKNGGTCAGNEEGFTCACDKLHTGPTCEEASFDPVALQTSITALEARVEKLEGEADAIPKTCKAIKDKDPSSLSGEYYIEERYGASLKKVYCEMERYGGGWARVAVIRASWSCPASMLHQKDEKDICTRPMSNTGSCAGATYGVPYPYKEVTGFVTGYTDRANDAFHVNEAVDKTINGIYVDGVSVTAGNPRRHIWTYAASWSQTRPQSCPCRESGGDLPPEFVGEHFYCSTKTVSDLTSRFEFNDDGHAWSVTDSCPIEGGCCNNGNPWFQRNFLEPSTHSLEIRLCNDQASNDEDIAIDEAELYVR